MRSFNRPYNFRPSGKTGSWYELKNLSSDVVDINIYDEIGYWGVTASSFVEDLQGVNASTINLHISSPGGDVFDGLAILNSLRQHKATVNVTVDGLAASAASFIAMAGDSIKIAPNAMMMIHEASGLVVGNSGDMREMADLLDKTSANIADIYARRAGGDPEEWRTAMRAETWYTHQEAVTAGLADSVVGEDTEEDPDEEEAPVAAHAGHLMYDNIDITSILSALKGA